MAKHRGLSNYAPDIDTVKKRAERRRAGSLLEDGHSVQEVANMTGLSRPTLYDIKKELDGE